MKQCLLGFFVCCFLSAPLGAQDYSRMEAYGGFQFMHNQFNNDEGKENDYLGVIGALELNLRSWLGIAGEFAYGNRLGDEKLLWPESSPSIERRYTFFLAGPRFGYRGGRIRCFGHMLIGVSRESITIVDDNYSDSDNSPAVALGLGADISVNDRISVRPVQFDLIGTLNVHSQIRYSGGVVIKFGSIQ